METTYKAIGWVRDKKGNVSHYNVKDVCNCITQFCGGFRDPDTGMANTLPYILISRDNGEKRIRKLTPRECFRFMGVNDEDIDKIQASGISNSSQYRLAGNSIVVDVLFHLFRKMFVETEPEERQLTLF